MFALTIAGRSRRHNTILRLRSSGDGGCHLGPLHSTTWLHPRLIKGVKAPAPVRLRLASDDSEPPQGGGGNRSLINRQPGSLEAGNESQQWEGKKKKSGSDTDAQEHSVSGERPVVGLQA